MRTTVTLTTGSQAHGMGTLDMGEYLMFRFPRPHVFVSRSGWTTKEYPYTELFIPLRNGEAGAELPTSGEQITMRKAKQLLDAQSLTWWPLLKKAAKNIMAGRHPWFSY